MIKLRKLHRYLGVFFIPTILFFAFTGALQTFGLHESEVRGAPPPTPWIATLASVHKDQRLPRPQSAAAAEAPAPTADARPAPAAEERPATAPAPAAASGHKRKSTLPLKLFVLAMAIGLILTALLGVYFALSNPRTRTETLLAIGLGALLPVLLLLF